MNANNYSLNNYYNSNNNNQPDNRRTSGYQGEDSKNTILTKKIF